MRVLVVEDNAAFCRLVVEGLMRAGFSADEVNTAGAARKAIATVDYSAVVLDLGLPDGEGVDLLRTLRSSTRALPIIVTTARDGLDDRVLGLQSGADDYLVKPVSMEVLVAKAQAMLRRTYDYRTPLLPTVQGARYDSAALYIEKDGVRVKLTPNEGKLLSCLISKRGKVVSREELMISLWDSNEFVDDNTLSVNMNRLRRKFEEVGVKNCIVTHRARGYALDG